MISSDSVRNSTAPIAATEDFPAIKRRLAAVLCADVDKYTWHVSGNEIRTFREMKLRIEEVIEPSIRRKGGRIFKMAGDGFFAEFASAVDALESSLEIQSEIARRNSSLPENQRLQFRIGLNLGEVVVNDNDLFGSDVIIAERLQRIASAGGICVSESFHRQAVGKVDIGFDDLGFVELKNFPEPFRVFRTRPITASDSAPSFDLPLQRASVTVLAVLPFENLSGAPSQAYWSDGITNDIITDLSKFSQVSVLASHSTFAYKDRQASVREVCLELGARYAVEGSVQISIDRVRINVQLVEGSEGRHVWAQRYDRPIAELFQLQDQIVRTIVGTLVGQLHVSEVQRALRSRPNNLQTYDVYLRGRAAFSDWTRASNKRAQELFRQTLYLDPTFSLAMGYLSFTLVQSWLAGWEQSKPVLEEALVLAKKAVELSPSEFDGHWSLAAVHLASCNFDKSMSAFERAIALNPNCPNLLVDRAECLVYVGRADDAIVSIHQAMEMNPTFPDWYYWTLGIAHYHAGNFAEAVSTLTKGNPPNLSRRHLAAAHVRLGELDAARDVATEFLVEDPHYKLSQERRWPYKDSTAMNALLEDLRIAGFPD